MFEGMTPEEIWGLVVIWGVLSALVAWVASSRGHSAVQWFFISFLLSPALGFILAILTKPKTPQQMRAPCPVCAEMIVYGASKCRFCGSELAPPRPT
jgi:hypothetical protein